MTHRDMLTAEQAALEAAGIGEFFSLLEAATEIDKMRNTAKQQSDGKGFQDGTPKRYANMFLKAHETYEFLLGSFHFAHFEGEDSCLILTDEDCHSDPDIRDCWSLKATRESIAQLLLEQERKSCAKTLWPEIEQANRPKKPEDSKERWIRLTKRHKEIVNTYGKRGSITRLAKEEGISRQTAGIILNRRY